jgi:hypothetical protein
LEARELRRDPRGERRELAGVLWWPPGKINGRYLTPWLAALDEETVADLPVPEPDFDELPGHRAIVVIRP